ncbi:MAG TPA: hypothetical protein VE398_17990 [Acidobacteriota bacterium]|nr:hypothetical protein [Acidobacteriota bacterium]
MIYLREGGGQYVGPFRSREDAERFIKLMELCGENWSDTEVVDEEGMYLMAGQRALLQ